MLKLDLKGLIDVQIHFFSMEQQPGSLQFSYVLLPTLAIPCYI